MAVNESPNNGWQHVLKALAHSQIECIVIGGAAMALHGIPRMTLDIDLYVPARPDALDNLFRCLLDECGLSSEQESRRRITHQAHLLTDQTMTFGTGDGSEIVDVFVVAAEVYLKLSEDALQLPVNGDRILVASTASLRQLKTASGRELDERDILLLDEYVRIRDSDLEHK